MVYTTTLTVKGVESLGCQVIVTSRNWGLVLEFRKVKVDRTTMVP
jgi:hypothetical protein